VLERQGEEYAIPVRVPSGEIVAYEVPDHGPDLLSLYVMQRIWWTAALRDEIHLLEREPWVEKGV
jgi:hypothetical protein